MKKKHIIILIIVFFGSILLDQLTKYIVANNMDIWETIEVIPGFFSIMYMQNTGAAWSIFEGHMIFFYIITIVAIVLLSIYFKNIKGVNLLARIGIILMVAGAFGNFIDRLSLQYVRDFLAFNIFGYQFPTFNVADMSLVIGIGILVLDEFLKMIGAKVDEG